MARYEFEHRTSGGVVEFKDYDSAKWHNKAKEKGEGAKKMAAVIVTISVIALVIALVDKVIP